MSEAAVTDILQKIQQLSEDDRLLLDQKLAELDETEWRRQAEQARRTAQERGLDQAAIDKAVEQVRYPS